MNWNVKSVVLGIFCLVFTCVIFGNSHIVRAEPTNFIVIVIDKSTENNIKSGPKVLFTNGVDLDKDGKPDMIQIALPVNDKDPEDKTKKKFADKGKSQAYIDWIKSSGPLPIGEIMKVDWSDNAIWYLSQPTSPGCGCVQIDTRTLCDCN